MITYTYFKTIHKDCFSGESILNENCMGNIRIKIRVGSGKGFGQVMVMR